MVSTGVHGQARDDARISVQFLASAVVTTPTASLLSDAESATTIPGSILLQRIFTANVCRDVQTKASEVAVVVPPGDGSG